MNDQMVSHANLNKYIALNKLPFNDAFEKVSTILHYAVSEVVPHYTYAISKIFVKDIINILPDISTSQIIEYFMSYTHSGEVQPEL